MRAIRMAMVAVLMAGAALILGNGSASASAGLAVDDYATLNTHPYGVLTVYGSATCSAPSGTATVDVSVHQIVRHFASGWGSTTISCTSQPTYWSVTLGSPNTTCWMGYKPQNCFAEGPATASATLTRNGSQEVGVTLQQVYIH